MGSVAGPDGGSDDDARMVGGVPMTSVMRGRGTVR